MTNVKIPSPAIPAVAEGRSQPDWNSRVDELPSSSPAIRAFDAVCGIIVSFNPSGDEFRETLRSAIGQVNHLVVVDNSTDEPARRGVREAIASVARGASHSVPSLIPMSGNTGLSHGLNEGLKLALMQGYSQFFLLDQDSVPAPGCVERLVEEHGRRCALGTPSLIAAQNEISHTTPIQRLLESALYGYLNEDRPSRPARIAITSGLLVDRATLQRTGLFDESMFVDSADHEFCLRARREKVPLYVVPESRVHHQLGENELAVRSWLGVTLRYTRAERLYYGVRDAVRTARRYWTDFPSVNAILIFLALLRTTAYRLGGAERRYLYLAARKGWVDALTAPDQPRIPPCPPSASST